MKLSKNRQNDYNKNIGKRLEGNMKTTRVLVISFLLLVLLSGCVDITQELTINSDGSGSISIDQGISKSVLDMGGDQGSVFNDLKKLETDLRADSTFKNIRVEEYTQDEMVHYKLSADFTNLDAMIKAFGQANLGTPVSLEKLDNGNYRFRQEISPANLGGESMNANDQASKEMVKSLFKDRFWTLRITVPNIVSTNGQRNGNQVEWKIPLADLMTSSEASVMELEFSLKSGVNNLALYLLIGGGIFLLAALVLLIVILTRKKQPQGYYPPSPPYSY